VRRLEACLQNMDWSPKLGKPYFELQHTPVLTHPAPPRGAQAADASTVAADSLRAQLLVLNWVRHVCPRAQDRAVIKLVGFPLGVEVMAALRGLPRWGSCTLNLSACVFTVSHGEVRELVDRYVPRCYAKVQLTADDLC
jgi:hypothetical protein